jgi:hypothetical protein
MFVCSEDGVPRTLTDFAAGRLGRLSEGRRRHRRTALKEIHDYILPPANHTANRQTAGSISVQYVYALNLPYRDCGRRLIAVLQVEYTHYGRLSSYSAHAQVHPQPPPRTPPDGCVSEGISGIPLWRIGLTDIVQRCPPPQPRERFQGRAPWQAR